MLTALATVYWSTSLCAAHIFSDLFPLNNIPSDVNTNLILTPHVHAPDIVRVNEEDDIEKKSVTKKYVSDIPIYEHVEGEVSDSRDRLYRHSEDIYDSHESVVEEVDASASEEVHHSEHSEHSESVAVETDNVIADATLEGECLWDGSGDGDVITLQLLCKQKKNEEECNLIRCRWIALLAVDDATDDVDQLEEEPVDEEQESEQQQLDVESEESMEREEESEIDTQSESLSVDIDSDESESEGIGAKHMEEKDAMEEEKYHSYALDESDSGVLDHSSSADSSLSEDIVSDEAISSEFVDESISKKEYESTDKVSTDNSFENALSGSFEQDQDEQSKEISDTIADMQPLSESADVIIGEDMDSKLKAMVEEEKEDDFTEKQQVSDSEEKWVPELPYEHDLDESEVVNEDRTESDSLESELSHSSHHSSHHEEEKEKTHSVHAHDEEEEVLLVDSVERVESAESAQVSEDVDDVDVVADARSSVISGDCVWDGTGSLDGATMAAFCAKYSERECIASQGGRKEGRCTWIGQLHSEPHDRSGRQRQSERSDVSMSSVVSSDEVEADNAPKLGCVWDGSGCHDGCNVEDMEARCDRLSHDQEDCEGLEGQSKRCVWSHGQVLEQELLDQRIASVVNFKLSVLDIVLGVVLMISIVFGLSQLKRWWNNREYKKVHGNGGHDVEPLLGNCV